VTLGCRVAYLNVWRTLDDLGRVLHKGPRDRGIPSSYWSD